MEYLEQLHNEHNTFPFLPENASPPNSKPKRYVIHFRNSKQAISNGLKLITIFGSIRFRQSDLNKYEIKQNPNLKKGIYDWPNIGKTLEKSWELKV